MENEEDAKPPKIEPRVQSAPIIRQIYWCDFQTDAHLPEFWKTRPVIIFSKTCKLNGIVTVIPMTTKSQPDNRHALSIKSPIGNKISWAVCTHITTVAVSRLSPPSQIIPRVSQEDFSTIVKLVMQRLPTERS